MTSERPELSSDFITDISLNGLITEALRSFYSQETVSMSTDPQMSEITSNTPYEVLGELFERLEQQGVNFFDLASKLGKASQLKPGNRAGIEISESWKDMFKELSYSILLTELYNIPEVEAEANRRAALFDQD